METFPNVRNNEIASSTSLEKDLSRIKITTYIDHLEYIDDFPTLPYSNLANIASQIGVELQKMGASIDTIELPDSSLSGVALADSRLLIFGDTSIDFATESCESTKSYEDSVIESDLVNMTDSKYQNHYDRRIDSVKHFDGDRRHKYSMRLYQGYFGDYPGEDDYLPLDPERFPFACEFMYPIDATEDLDGYIGSISLYDTKLLTYMNGLDDYDYVDFDKKADLEKAKILTFEIFGVVSGSVLQKDD